MDDLITHYWEKTSFPVYNWLYYNRSDYITRKKFKKLNLNNLKDIFNI